MIGVPVHELMAGTFGEAVDRLAAEPDNTDLTVVLMVVKGPAPAPGSRETAEVLALRVAARLHTGPHPMHVVRCAFEQLITAADVEAVRFPVNDPAEAAEFAESQMATAADLRANPDDHALAIALSTVPCPHGAGR